MSSDEKPEAAEVQGGKSPKKERSYYLDWLRTISIHFVLFAHCIAVAEELRKGKQPNDSYKTDQ